MVKAWTPTTPNIRENFRTVWVGYLELIYTSTKNEFTSQELCRELGELLPGVDLKRIYNAGFNVRRYLLKNGVIETKRIPAMPHGGVQMLLTVINRDRLPAIIKKCSTRITPLDRKSRAFGKYIPQPVLPESKPVDMPEPVLPTTKEPTELNGVVTRTERIVAALYKRCLEYKREVAELVDELAVCRASVHDATRKVNATNEAIRRSERVASEIDLAEVGINLEE